MLHFTRVRYYSAIVLIALPFGGVRAASQSMQADIAFVTPLQLAVVAVPDFGTLAADQAGTYILSTSGAVTAPEAMVVAQENKSAGMVNIAGASDQTISISAGNYVTSGGITPSGATCKYGTAPA